MDLIKSNTLDNIKRTSKKKIKSIWSEFVDGMLDSLTLTVSSRTIYNIVGYFVYIFLCLVFKNYHYVISILYLLIIIEIKPLWYAQYNCKKYLVRLVVSRILFYIFYENVEDWLFYVSLPIFTAYYLLTPHLMMQEDHGWQSRIDYVVSRYPYLYGYYLLLSISTYLYFEYDNYDYLISVVLMINMSTDSIGKDKYTKFNREAKYAKWVPYTHITHSTDIIEIIERYI